VPSVKKAPYFESMALLAGIEHPSRYLGGEVVRPETRLSGSSPRLRVVLGFPDTYEVGMSHLGFRLLHATLCDRGDLEVERVFLPYPDLQRRLLERHAPLFSLESGAPVASADLLGLSLQYELAMPSVLRLLDLARIPRRSEERARSAERWPLVLVGGSGALNPEPLAPFVDAFFVGEADLALHGIVDALAEVRGAPLAERVARLAALEGLYLPSLVDAEHERGGLGVTLRARPPARLPVQRVHVEDLDALAPPRTQLVPVASLVHDRITVEIQRGCCQGCRFCQAGSVTRPTRQRSAAGTLAQAREALAATGYEDLSLLSLSAGDHPRLQEILAGLIAEHAGNRVAISLPSMRTESLHPAVAALIAKLGKAGFTLAPEAATDRLRRVINKGNREEDLLASVRGAAAAGYAQLKLYFMIGLPTETDADLAAIPALAERAWAEARRVTRHVQLTVSVSTFVPKPHTPFQWEASPSLAEVERKQALLRERTPRRLRLKWHDPAQSLVEAYLARADRRMASVLERLVTPDHLGLDAWTEHFELARWERALEAAHAADEIPSPERWLGPRDPALGLPWDGIDVGVERRYLEAEWRAARAEAIRPDCVDGRCDQCGVCPVEPLHRLALEPAPELAPAGPAVEPGPATTLRFWFRKEGRACLVSHLEMVGAFERAARRARLPLAFSSGYHPKPRLRFSPALPLGAASRCEFVELALATAPELEGTLAELARELPPGFTLERAEPVTSRAEELLPRIREVAWRLELADAPARLEAARARLAAGGLRLRRGEGARQRELDLGAAIAALELDGEEAIVVRCRVESHGTPRPSELLQLLCGLDAEAARAVPVTRIGWGFAP
jgi:radical SAM family uncharacterized protein/radical SAM-linked protein